MGQPEAHCLRPQTAQSSSSFTSALLSTKFISAEPVPTSAFPQSVPRRPLMPRRRSRGHRQGRSVLVLVLVRAPAQLSAWIRPLTTTSSEPLSVISPVTGLAAIVDLDSMVSSLSPGFLRGLLQLVHQPQELRSLPPTPHRLNQSHRLHSVSASSTNHRVPRSPRAQLTVMNKTNQS